MPVSTIRLIPVDMVVKWKNQSLPAEAESSGLQHHVMIHKEPEEEDEPKTTWQEQVNEVLEMLPVPYQKRGRKVMTRLRDNLELSDDWQMRVKWAPNPETGVVEPGSHLMDLLQYLLMTGAARQKSTMTKPLDFESFITLLASVGVPDSVVGAEMAQRMKRARRLLNM